MQKSMTGASEMSVSRMVRQLSDAYIGLIRNRVSFRRFPSVMLWGAPGVGKSQGVRQMAEEIGEQTGRKVLVTDVRLLLFNPVDLRGIPTVNADRTLAVWLKPKVFEMDPSEDVVNILFLDEISAAPQSVQAAAYQITLDRTIGEHRLPENCIVIAAGNRVTDRSVAYNMPKALANRLCHIEITVDADGWQEWAVRAGIHETVRGFIRYKPSILLGSGYYEESLAYPTPRSGEMVSNILNDTDCDVEEAMPLIRGCVGEKAAEEFFAWSRMYEVLPDAAHVFDGKLKNVPTSPEVLYSLITRIVRMAGSCTDRESVSNMTAYLDQFPAEFRSVAFEDILCIRPLRRLLKDDPVFCRWFDSTRRDWSDYRI